MFVTTLDRNDLIWLSFAAGIAAGGGNAEAQRSLVGILSRVVEVEDGAPIAYGEAPDTNEEDYSAQLDAIEADDFEGTVDPLFMPVPPAPPSRPQSEFGPGPVRGQLG